MPQAQRRRYSGCVLCSVACSSWSWPRASSPNYPQPRSCLCLRMRLSGVNLLFQQDGISLRSVLPDTCPPVLIHRARTLQALSRVLLIVHGLSRAQDTVELIASSSADEVQIVIRNLNLSVATINAEARLSMAVAEANMRSQQAGLSSEPAAVHCVHRTAEGAIRLLVLELHRCEIRSKPKVTYERASPAEVSCGREQHHRRVAC